MISVNREELLQKLESVTPGLSPRDIVEQSSCFVFKDGMLITYNGEDACRRKLVMDLTGAVQAVPLLSMLRQMPEEVLEIGYENGELLIHGKRRKSGIVMEKDVLLPIENVEQPGKWIDLPEDFSDAISIVQACASKDESKPWITCVHLHPKWIEACDNHQVTRYKIAIGIETAALVRSSSIKHIVDAGMTQFSATENFIHFRNKSKLIFSIRRYADTTQFPNMTNFLKVSGVKTQLPKGLAAACEKAEVFASEKSDDGQVLVQLFPGKLRIRGQGVSGWYQETTKLNYSGEPMRFLVSPKLLIELTKRHNECEISSDFLKVDGGKFTYVTCLGREEEKEETATAEE